MTYFNEVKLPASALLGDSSEAPKDARAAWWENLIGSFAMTGPCVSGFKHTAYIGGTYSLRRTVAHILDTWYREVAPIFTDPETTQAVKHRLAVLAKAIVFQLVRQVMERSHEMAERYGAQGTFDTR